MARAEQGCCLETFISYPSSESEGQGVGAASLPLLTVCFERELPGPPMLPSLHLLWAYLHSNQRNCTSHTKAAKPVWYCWTAELQMRLFSEMCSSIGREFLICGQLILRNLQIRSDQRKDWGEATWEESKVALFVEATVIAVCLFSNKSLGHFLSHLGTHRRHRNTSNFYKGWRKNYQALSGAFHWKRVAVTSILNASLQPCQMVQKDRQPRGPSTLGNPTIDYLSQWRLPAKLTSVLNPR